MPMTYSDAQASIQHNNWFQSRVQQAVSVYSNYLLNATAEDPEYDAKINAGMSIARQSAMVVQTLMFTLAGDAEVLAAGPAIPDAQLQMIVEKTVQKFWPVTSTPAGMYYAAPPLPVRPPQ